MFISQKMQTWLNLSCMWRIIGLIDWLLINVQQDFRKRTRSMIYKELDTNEGRGGSTGLPQKEFGRDEKISLL